MTRTTTSDGRFVTPFDREDFQKLKDAQRQLNDLLSVMDRAEACGTDCQVFREVTREYLERLMNIEREFMNPPPR
jgi:hypothetical protein